MKTDWKRCAWAGALAAAALCPSAAAATEGPETPDNPYAEDARATPPAQPSAPRVLSP